MPPTIFALIFLTGAVLYFMTPAERHRLVRRAHLALRRAHDLVMPKPPSDDPFNEFLSARTQWPLVTPLLLFVNVGVFVAMMVAPGAIDKQALIEWGANYAPRTTNGEWVRWITSMFVHASPLHLAATVAALATIGSVLERTVGRIAFAAAFLASGIIASIVSVSTSSATAVTCGASGALFGVYGLLVATVVCGYLRSPRIPVSMHVVKRIAIGGLVCVGYTWLTDHLGLAAELAGMTSGLTAGLVISRGVAQAKPALTRAALVALATLVIAVASVAAVDPVVDARPNLMRVGQVEGRTSAAYSRAIGEFTQGTMTAAALADVIERTILPPLKAQRRAVNELRGVPREQEPLLVSVRQYFHLREESWRRRVEGLRRSNAALLRSAERTEREALEALERANEPVTPER